MKGTRTVLNDPEGRFEEELPLDRATHQCLVEAVLAWKGDPALATADYEQIALLLTGAARSVAGDLQRSAARLPKDHQALAPADVVLEEAERRLASPLEGTARCAQDRARLVRTLYERLDRLTKTFPVPVP
ncbi:restriction endonuclease (plasmid) [Streptomyces sp. NBC_00053]|uniref:restriction endonuclease n=1 Tax=unclassified Streptomyces TaxID=2593676 RepID=UPI000F5BBE81|nr:MULTISPECIES: restriction endonuclease [unclassified Streptomyces]MCX4400037.1 restriction endonuclease [Streptomyces sp. NBC_01767]MCX5505964.1 restriction endonuclease [Streptomyces sp. NBC_00052]MCX5554037.1 restriction endonuclease [Streptomyces sp. NBC_00051]MCX5554383.1 restriction endonuclease [Streptomyces sp. NBC_00051]RPK56040.1 hypothetical protein EES42_41310 [Streptomyces sp. ADI95-17]